MQREINRLLKRISAEKLKNNHKECIELYNIVGGLYSDVGSYEEAIHYHDQALQSCRSIGDRLGTAIAYRYIGESQAALGDYLTAIENIEKYLELTQRIQNKVEVQRAYTTLGRVYLMQAHDLKDNSPVIDNGIKLVASKADKRFQQALKLAESIRDQVDEKEFAQMRSALLLNIGLVKEILGEHRESVSKIAQAIELCKTSKLKEDLYRCQIILAGIYRQRNDINMAPKISEAALETAKSIGKKIMICEALIENGLVKILQRDFKNAKRTLARAYLEKSPNEEDHAKAIKLTKLAHLIATNYEKISKQDVASETRYKLCDKLGDLFVAVGLYKLGIEYYKKAFTDAKICNKPKAELARIIYSIAETYADEKLFDHALICYEKELNYRDGNKSEQCSTLMKIALMHLYLNHEPKVVCESYEEALTRANKDPVLMYRVLKEYVPYVKDVQHFTLAKRNELTNTFVNLKAYPEVLADQEREIVEEEVEELEDEIADIDDIITDDEDDDEVLMIGRKRVRGNKKFKANEVGDTPLHEACIKGDMKRVKCLISQGHDVNPRDNAGWIPLHEACNHGHYEIVEYLIEHGADVCNRGLKGTSPLHDAATNGHYEIMRLLIKNGANVIALTDTGETVLGCLRDYKKRSTSMSNAESSEYKTMEAELLNHMDKCGFNLMEENMKNLSAKKSTFSASGKSQPFISESQRTPVVRTKENRNILDPNNMTESVKDYRDIIGTLKRRRLNDNQAADEQDELKKANLPAIYHSDTNTSAPTKEWLIDDVSREKRIVNRRSNLRSLMESEVDDLFDDEDDSEIMEVCRNKRLERDSGVSSRLEKEKSRKTSHETSNDERSYTPQPSTSNASSTLYHPPARTNYQQRHKSYSIRDSSNIINRPKVVPHKKTVLISDDEFDDDDDAENSNQNLEIGSSKHNQMQAAGNVNSATDSKANSNNFDGDEDSDEVMVIDERKTQPQSARYVALSPAHSVHPPSQGNGVPSPIGLPLDADDYDDEAQSPMSESVITLHTESNDNDNTDKSATGAQSLENVLPSFNILQQPLEVSIEGRKLLIPIRDKLTTIQRLKQMIVQRFSVLVEDAQPKISVSPLNDPSLFLYDEDLCQDVLKQQRVLARVESWQLDTLTDSYLRNCSKLNVEARKSVTIETKRIERLGNKLDLAYAPIPLDQAGPLALSLARRDFAYVNLTGASCLFSTAYSFDQERRMLDAIVSWRKMTQLNLSCVSLVRAQFELLCAELKITELSLLNLSYNQIHYKCKFEFKTQLELLLDNCAKLKRLDFRKNYLLFVAKATSSSSVDINNSEQQQQEPNLAEWFDLCASVVGDKRRKDLQIYCQTQVECDVYSA